MLYFKDVTIAQGSKVLFSNASFAFSRDMRVGIVGRNGCGKSSLFAAILDELETQRGDITFQNNIKLSHIKQEIYVTDIPAIDFILQGDSELYAINTALQQAEAADDHTAIMRLHHKLSDIDGYSAPARAAKLLSGLGFSDDEHTKPVAQFSGGWRMRLNIAKCLMERSDLLLLDEPTNHLDLETVYWLEKWLMKYTGCLIIISHDREFLDNVTNKILHIEHGQVKVYSGNYSDFETQRAAAIQLQTALYNKQQEKAAHLMSFVNRFRAKASKAKQAQSRLKALAKLETVALAQADSPFQFEFLDCPKQPTPLVRLYQTDIGYTSEDSASNALIIKKVSLNIEPGARIALLGKNGAGKSTLIKTITGLIPALGGEINIHTKTKIGYFHQHTIDYLDLSKTPLQTFIDLSPGVPTTKIRGFLGGFAFSGDVVNQNITNFSGGEKTRLALAIIVWQQPNLLLLDEPTNHLDLDMRESLAIALQSFTGAVILVSHDQHLLQTTADRLLLIKDKTLKDYQGDLDDYLNQR